MGAVPGDRRDEEFFSGAEALAGHYDHYVCRNFHNTRGRPETEIPELMKAGLLAAGVPEDAITIVPDSSKAIDHCLDMATAGDLIVLCIYDPEFDPTWEKLQKLSRAHHSQHAPDTDN
jgi:cyanophycin synthetase